MAKKRKGRPSSNESSRPNRKFLGSPVPNRDREYDQEAEKFGGRHRREDLPPTKDKPWHQHRDLVVGILLACGAAIMTIVLLLLPVDNKVRVVLLVLMFLLLAFSVALVLHYFDWLRVGIVVGPIVSAITTLGFGWYVWPISPTAQQAVTKTDLWEMFEREHDIPPSLFEMHVEQALFNYNARLNLTEVLLAVSIKNSGGPCVTSCWSIHYHSSKLDKDNLRPINPVSQPLYFLMSVDPTDANRGIALEYYSARGIADTTILVPINKDSPAVGRLLINVPGDRRDEIRSGDAVIDVTICDHSNNQYNARYQWDYGPNNHPRLLPRETLVAVRLDNRSRGSLPLASP